MRDNEMSLENIDVIFSSVGTILDIILNITPAVLILNVMTGKESYKIIPELMLIVSIITRLTFVCYWQKEKRLVPLLNAIIGTILSSVFFCIYLYYYTLKNKYKWFMYALSQLFAEIFLYIIYMAIFKSFILGRMTLVLNSAVYISPSQNILKVIKEKNYKLIPIWTTLVGILCSICWFTYGMIIKNSNTIISNIVGIIASLVATYTWVYYYCKSKNKKANKLENVHIEIKKITEETSSIKNFIDSQ